jgi:hypothetical protein
MATSVNGQIISEFEPNPDGSDPATTFVEIFGTANAAYDLNLLSLENDGISGVVDRAINVTGSFDANGLAVEGIPDLENPSFTLLLTGTFFAIGTDLDADDDGVLEGIALGDIFDAVGVSDSTADDGNLYASGVGGIDILFNGTDEPAGVFRAGSDGDFFQYVAGSLFTADGTAFDPNEFSSDPLTTTYGDFNPSLSAIPEPTGFALLALAGFVGLTRRRK